MNLHSTDLDRNFKQIPDDPKFTASFLKGFILSVLTGFVGSILLILAVLNADRIDHFFSEIVKSLFL